MTFNTSPNPLAYTGLDPVINPQSISVNRAPNINDWQSFYPGDQWRDESVTPNVWYVLRSVSGNKGDWEAYTGGSGSTTKIIADSGSATPSGGAITVSGGTTGLTTTAAGSTVDLTGTLNPAHGGTGATTLTGVLIGNGTSAVTGNPVTQHDVLVGGASNAITSIVNGTTGQIFQATSASDPGWTTATYPSTTTANDILYSSATNVVGQISTAANGVLITSNASVPSLLANSGTPGYVLTANSGAPPSWQAAGLSSFQVNIQVKTTTGNYAPSANLLYCIVEILGGGAAGGGSNATGAGQYSIGGGGSAGEYARGVFSLAQIQADAGWTGTVLPFTIGAAGTGVSAGTGGSGGTTSFGTGPLISSNGGAGATAGLQQAGGNYSIGIGGVGGSGGTGGSFRSRGANGFTGVIFSTAGAASDGMGASTLYGSGGIIFGAIAAAGYGAGGFGNTSANGTGALAGSNGVPGVIIITEYIS